MSIFKNKADKPNYDCSWLESSGKELEYKSFYTFIDAIIRDYRKEYNYGNSKDVPKITREYLAKELKLDLDTITKIINGRQKTRKRDLIIALCFALKLSERETRLALDLYPMTQLNNNNMRDIVILHGLRDGLSVEQLNEVLKAHKFSVLDICRSNEKKEELAFYYPLSMSEYEEVSVKIYPHFFPDDILRKSLHDRYRPDLYDYYGEMVIRNKTDGTEYKLVDDGTGYRVSVLTNGTWKNVYAEDQLFRKYEKVDACDKPEMLNEIAKLREYIDDKARYIHGMCDDTRYYGTRFDAINDDGKFIIYGEGFNFDSPELCEYYQIELSSRGGLYTITNESTFLQRYLGKDEWKKMYGKTELQHAKKSFKSIHELTDKREIAQFKKLLAETGDFVEGIKERKLFMFNAHERLGIDELMHLFKVEDAFECYQPDDMPYEIIPKKKYIKGYDGKKVTIEDLYRAAELEITSMEELCTIRTQYGSLNGFINVENNFA